MDAQREAELQNAAMHAVSLLRGALATESCSPLRMGGSGQRKLNVVAPEAEGYTGYYLIKTVGAKGCLYIMPIQNSVDFSPLPYSSKEFEKMPNVIQTCMSRSVRQMYALTAVIVNRTLEIPCHLIQKCHTFPQNWIVNVDDLENLQILKLHQLPQKCIISVAIWGMSLISWIHLWQSWMSRYLVLCVWPCIQKTTLKYMQVPLRKDMKPYRSNPQT